jgi:translocator assembly and maintenance protein 41
MVDHKIIDFISSKPEVIDIIGYGSGVKKQEGYTNDIKRQIDIISTVDNINEWHNQNYKLNKKEYYELGFKFNKIYNKLGTDINYISNIDYKGDTFKLGIIEKDDLLKDLYTWKNFFVAGRFQKPIIKIKSDEELDKAIYFNRLSALKVALLLNYNNKITEKDLYKTICDLSYIGDIRMMLHCENPNKVDNIVSASFNDFNKIYSEVNEDLFIIKNNEVLINNNIINNYETLPYELLVYLDKNMNVLSPLEFKICIIEYLNKTNLKSSIAQPCKSMMLNGPSKSLIYLKEKINKSKM